MLPRSPTTSHRLPSVVALSLVLAVFAAACSSGSTDDGSTASTPETTTTTEGPAPGSSEPVELPADRPVEVIVPSGYDESDPAPLVVLLHGYGFAGEVQDAYLQMSDAAEQRGVLLVTPDGTKNDIGRQFWNATDACCGGDSDVDDDGYLTDVIASVRQDYAVDPDRIYFVGHSNGGFMSFRMACNHADTVAAIASIAGATFGDADACDPSEPVATLQIHGDADETIEYEGGTNSGVEFPSAADTLALWGRYNGCDVEQDLEEGEARSIVTGAAPATVVSYGDSCDPGGTSELWTLPDGPHIPAFTDDFSDQVLDWLLDHPKV